VGISLAIEQVLVLQEVLEEEAVGLLVVSRALVVRAA
jgi:hypothetical protein